MKEVYPKVKIYFVDKTGKNSIIRKNLEKNSSITIEVKESLSFRSTKNDYIVLSEYNEKDNSILLNKFQNVILIMNIKDPNLIWKAIHEYKIIDIIDALLSPEYIAKRILKLVS